MDIRNFFQKNSNSSGISSALNSNQERNDGVANAASPNTAIAASSSPARKKLRIDEESSVPLKEEDNCHGESFGGGQAREKLSPKMEYTSTKAKQKTDMSGPPIKPITSIPSYTTDQATPGLLQGLNFVFTGVLSTMGREDAEDYIKILGGKVTTAVSGKTNYLICGTVLEDGRPVHEGSKYRKAIELGDEKVAILHGGEGEMYALVQLLDQRLKMNLTQSSPETTLRHSSPTTAHAALTSANIDPAQNNTYAKNKTPPMKNPYAKKNSAASASTTHYDTGSTSSANPYAKKTTTTAPLNPTSSSSSHLATAPKIETVTRNEIHEKDNRSLWTDKYAPKTSKEILGHKECINKLAAWLDHWEAIFNNQHLSKNGKKISLGNPQGPFKAALLSGPPGIGKSTTANLVAKEHGRQVLEWNASDTRSKKSLAENLGDVTGSHILSFDHPTGDANMTNIKRCIIMDEVDGMGAGDRSGMAELIKMIKASKVPIICICNDRQSPKIKSLAAYCLDLRFHRPVKSVIARWAQEIGTSEGLRVETNAAEAIAESCGNDIRQVINCLQMWASKKGTESMTYKDLKERVNFINKDEILRVSIFDATKMIVEGRRGISNAVGVNKAKAEVDSLFMRNDAFFTEYSLMGLNVHQNYLSVMIAPFKETKRCADSNAELKCLDRMCEATSSMSDYAVVDHAVMSGDQQWALLPLCAMLTIKAGFHAGGEQGSFLPGFPEFTGWLGKNSSKGKMKRLLLELRHHMNFSISGDVSELRLMYIPSFRERFIKLLKSDDPQIRTAIELMDEYGIDRDDLFENLDEFTLDPKPLKMADLDSKVKASFTREYNKCSHRSQALVDEQGVTKTRQRRMKDENEDDYAHDDEDDVKNVDKVDYDDDDEEKEDEDNEKIQKLFKTRSKSKSTTSKSDVGKSTGKKK